MRWWRGAGFVIAMAAALQLVAAACGDDDGSAGGPAGDDGGSGDGGATPDPSAARTPATACEAYIRAQCARAAECTGRPSPRCTDHVDLCPDYHFASGSTRTVDALFACAEEVRSIGCDEYLAGVRPSRCTPGTRKGGEGCRFPSQCESERCGTQLGSGVCGQCYTLVTGDMPCDLPEVECGTGRECDRMTNRCVPVVRLDAGAPCSADQRCRAPADCYAAAPDAAAGTCRELPSAGSPCAYALGRAQAACANAHYCRHPDGGRVGGACERVAALGEPCGRPSGQHFFVPCGDDGYCPRPADGQPSTCTTWQVVGGSCAAGQQCDPRAAYCHDGLCRAARRAGESCSVPTETGPRQVSCAEGSFCVAGDGGVLTCVASGSAGETSARGAIGEACDDAGKPCRDLLECASGTCRRPDLSACDDARDR